MSHQSSDNKIGPLYTRHDLRFECTRCGRCCTGGADRYVYVSELEAEKIRLVLGVGRKWFRQRYVSLLEDGDMVLQSSADRCIFLQRDGSCRVYEARPVQCSSYPFWPEIVKTAAAWQREARRCEGIGRGGVIPLSVIEARLKCIGIRSDDDE